MSNQKRKKEGNNQEEIEPLKISSEKQNEKNQTPYRTVGTVRKSKNGNAISVKLFPDNRYLHISIKDVERILTDENNQTVGNVREYERRN